MAIKLCETGLDEYQHSLTLFLLLLLYSFARVDKSRELSVAGLEPAGQISTAPVTDKGCVNTDKHLKSKIITHNSLLTLIRL